MESGKLRHRVTWLSITEAVTNGKISNTETTIGTYWANVETTGSGEATTSNKVQATKTYTVTMRYVGDIKQKDRLTWNGKILQVQSVINTENRNFELILGCTEVA